MEQAERLFAGQAVPDADPEDARELLNYRDAFEFVSGYLNDGGPITEGLVREIHRRLVVGVRGGVAHPGEYRHLQNYVANSKTGQVIYTPPPPLEVPPLMVELVAWLNAPTEIHPVLASGIAQIQLVNIHPFVDGNGRASRLLSTLCLYRAGYDFKRLFSISEYYDRDRASFYAALQGVREQAMDLTGWLDYFVDGLATQMDEVKERGERVIKADVMAAKHRFNARQKSALRFLLEHGKMTIQDYEALCPQAHRRSLQRDLQGLVKAASSLSAAPQTCSNTSCYENLRQTRDRSCDKLATQLAPSLRQVRAMKIEWEYDLVEKPFCLPPQLYHWP